MYGSGVLAYVPAASPVKPGEAAEFQ